MTIKIVIVSNTMGFDCDLINQLTKNPIISMKKAKRIRL